MTGARDRTAEALRQLEIRLAAARDGLDLLIGRTRLLAERLAAGSDLTAAMQAEERPLIITSLTALIDDLQLAGGELRRAEAAQLREEGLTQEQIAAVFGVTRQRAAALLKDPAPPRRTPKRPA